MKESVSRLSVPGIVWDLLWRDDEFYREIASNKRVSSSGKFPRSDQWSDSSGFHMAFALAGYSSKDIRIDVCGSEISIVGTGSKLHADGPCAQAKSHESDNSDDYPSLTPNVAVQRGIIVRGIARRNFKLKFYINPLYDPSSMVASMRDGLLELVMPREPELKVKTINIAEES